MERSALSPVDSCSFRRRNGARHLAWTAKFLFISFILQKTLVPQSLTLTKTATVEVFPGDTIDYALTYENTGPDEATGVAVVDTLPQEVQFLSATGPFVYGEGIPATVTWDLGTVSPNASGELQLRVLASPEFEQRSQIVNTAWISSNEGVSIEASATTTNILPMNLTLNSDPRMILGNGADSSSLTAEVYSFLGNTVPDGIPVSFTQDIGIIPEGIDTVETRNGRASSTLVSSVVTHSSKGAIVNARANFSLTQFASDTTRVVFLLGALEGVVIDEEGDPIPDVTVDLFRISTGTVLGSDTTGSDGYYFMPIHITDAYHLIFTFIDEYGNPIVMKQPVAFEDIPQEGSIEANQNSLSGWLYDVDSGKRIDEAGIPIMVTSQEDGRGSAKTGEGVTYRDSTHTDSTGFYYFANLKPGKYELWVLYSGVRSYKDGHLGVDVSTPGNTIIDVNVPLEKYPFYTYKKVDRWFAEREDTLTYTLYYGSIDVAVSGRVHVVDNLPKELTLVEDSYQLSAGVDFESYDSDNNIIRFSREGLQINEADSIIFKARVDGDLSSINPDSKTGHITNRNLVTDLVDSTSSIRDRRSQARTTIFLDVLSVNKTTRRRSVERGDWITYVVKVTNKSDELILRRPSVIDLLPYGFKYRSGSRRSYWESNQTDDPLERNRDQHLRLIWTIEDTLNPGESRELRYRALVGITSRYGENENRAYATALVGEGALIHSRESAASVIVRPGIISNIGLIFGKVYYDPDSNNVHDQNDPPVQGVEIILENGTRVTTDEFGKYSVPNIRSGDHVLRVNSRSLPERTRVVLNSADFLGDPRSRLVKLSPGGIAKANFVVEKIPEPEPEPEPIQELDVALSEVPKIRILQSSLVEDLRFMLYKPWSMTLREGFLPGEATLRPEVLSELRRIGDFLQWQHTTVAEITGHTDAVPPPPGSTYENNVELSKARADSIEAFLDREMNILPQRMTTYGLGDTEPLADNSTEEGRALNRRVEFKFISPYEVDLEKTLRFIVTLSYPDDVPLNQIQFHSILPTGWVYAENSGLLDGVPFSPSDVTNLDITWDLGEWSGPTETELEFGLAPLEPKDMASLSTLRSRLRYAHPDGSTGSTDTLYASISTRVEEMLLRMVLAGTQFDVNSATLRPSAIPSLFLLGEFLTWQDRLTITSEGFTDATGTLEWNMELSENRAGSAQDYLVENHGISPDRIRIEGFGPQFPVGDNDTREGRALNRRVEVIVNSDFEQTVSLRVVATDDSLEQEVFMFRELVDPPSPLEVFTLASGDTSKLRLGVDLMGLTDVDSVLIGFDWPEGIDLPDLEAWMLPVQPGQERLIREFVVVVSPEVSGEQTVQLRVQPYSKGEEKYGPTEKSMIFLIE